MVDRLGKLWHIRSLSVPSALETEDRAMHDTSVSPNTKGHAEHAGRRETDWMGFIGLAAGIAVLCVSVFSRDSFHALDARWNSLFLGLACFSLGLGAACLVFGRYRARQTQRLREEYTDLHSRAEALLTRIRSDSASSPEDSL
jgi:hypothetical protein